jgi:hypothetical protein
MEPTHTVACPHGCRASAQHVIQNSYYCPSAASILLCLPSCLPPYTLPAFLQVGAALAELFTEGVVSREQLFITGKLWNSSHAPKDVQPALAKTLQDLGVSCAYRELQCTCCPAAVFSLLACLCLCFSP